MKHLSYGVMRHIPYITGDRHVQLFVASSREDALAWFSENPGIENDAEVRVYEYEDVEPQYGDPQGRHSFLLRTFSPGDFIDADGDVKWDMKCDECDAGYLIGHSATCADCQREVLLLCQQCLDERYSGICSQCDVRADLRSDPLRRLAT